MVAEFIGETNFIEARVRMPSSESGLYEVDTDFGPLRARTNDPDWKPMPGTSVTLSIRPEALTFGHMLDSTNRLPCHIVDTVYLGATVQYQLQIIGGPQLKVCEINPRQIRPPAADEIRVMAAAADVVMLPQH
jgi:ABC-type Fe3+/spermidine/putrescine transport system ATPase subunit